jgi:carboxylesterase
VVPPVNARLIASAIGSPQIEMIGLENSFHVATLDNDQDVIVDRSLRFIERVTARR